MRLTLNEAQMVANVIRDFATIQYHPGLPLLAPAFALASDIGSSLYDGLILALAIQLGGAVVTADQPFHNKILRSSHAAHDRWYMTPP